jgi:hypothetical protein
MKRRLRHLVVAIVLTGLISVSTAGCVAVPISDPGYAYGPPPPVVVVPAPVYGGYYRGGYYRGRHRGYHGYGHRH